MNQDIDNQIAEIKRMLFKNINMIITYLTAPDNDKPFSKESFDKLVFRTDMLQKCVKDTASDPDSTTDKK